MARYEYYNYLFNLPNASVVSHKLPYQVKKLVEFIISSDNNTEDIDLLDFRYKLISLIINKTNKYGVDFLLDDYFKIRNGLTTIREEIIKNNKDSLINLLTNEDKMVNCVNKLDNLYDFNARYERVKVDNKYKTVKKVVNKYDFLLYIREFGEKSKFVAGKIIKSYNSSQLSGSELEKIVSELGSDEVIDKILKAYDDEFLVFKECKIDIFEYLYVFYKKEVLKVIKNTLNENIRTKCHKEFIKNNEILRYACSIKKSNLYLGNHIWKKTT